MTMFHLLSDSSFNIESSVFNIQYFFLHKNAFRRRIIPPIPSTAAECCLSCRGRLKASQMARGRTDARLPQGCGGRFRARETSFQLVGVVQESNLLNSQIPSLVLFPVS
jgi:hypothetical protein